MYRLPIRGSARRIGRAAAPAHAGAHPQPWAEFDRIVRQRRAEADEFYEAIHPPKASEDERRIQRQALAGMLWRSRSTFST